MQMDVRIRVSLGMNNSAGTAECRANVDKGGQCSLISYGSEVGRHYVVVSNNNDPLRWVMPQPEGQGHGSIRNCLFGALAAMVKLGLAKGMGVLRPAHPLAAALGSFEIRPNGQVGARTIGIANPDVLIMWMVKQLVQDLLLRLRFRPRILVPTRVLQCFLRLQLLLL